MRYFLTFLLAAFFSAASAQARINIFACEPEWASLAAEIATDKANITSATHAYQDPHHIRARPSLLAKMRRADLLICSGASLEVGWLPILLLNAGKPEVQAGKTGHIMVSEHVKMLAVPEAVDRIHGDVHPEGNPHVHLNPHNIIIAAEIITERLTKIDANNAEFYQNNKKLFLQKWRRSIESWQKSAAQLSGMQIISYHKSWEYLIDWLDLNELANLESKPGIAPTARHLNNLLELTIQNEVKRIIRSPYAPSLSANWLGN